MYCQANSFVQGGQGPPAPLRNAYDIANFMDSTINSERLQHCGGGGAASYSLEAGQSSDRVEVYWSLAPDTGAISLRGDLTNELYFEYRLVDRAGVRADQLFRGQLNAAKDCVLVLARSGLDPETMPSYTAAGECGARV